ncbi:hypothetical protein RE6C_00935 [Rhodopirellula europaea 6C]|uniref:Uncharacterized protein n=1 Tax=Rhodopirellula europaea 6C TaxID=1263867 RepID=M2B063_9BACT|nr:hypothetical protein RE6C_00935 [Rhodopirellula europaea 6C]
MLLRPRDPKSNRNVASEQLILPRENFREIHSGNDVRKPSFHG